jgi:hypothetical protein
MMARSRDTTSAPVEAVQTVFAALEPLDDATRQRVLASVAALLGMTGAPVTGGPSANRVSMGGASRQSGTQSTDRPVSLVELLQQKPPKSIPQKIALFAYYRERVEGQPRFARADLKSYFATAKEKPAGNYDRDFTQAVKLGLIHEDGADSYLTSRGLEAVESGFAHSASAAGGAKAKRAAPKRTRSRARKSTKR